MIRSQKYPLLALLSLCLSLFPVIKATAQEELNVKIAGFKTSYFPQVHLYVQVSDENNTPITGLTKENFSVFENNLVAFFDMRPYLVEGTSFGLALDCSGSMANYEEEVIEAAESFINNMRPLDNAALIFYESYYNTQTIQTMTNDQAALLAAAGQYYAAGQTALWYGYQLALTQCQNELIPRVLIGFTDGQDNQSFSYTLESVSLFARSLGCPLYSIGIGNVDPDPLIEAAMLTNGEYIDTTPDSLEFYYNQILDAYQNMYEIAYISPDPITNGGLRTPEVTVSNANLSASDTMRFSAPWSLNFAPRITLTEHTLDTMMTASQPNNTPMTIDAYIVDNDILTITRIKHRLIGETTWQTSTMTNISDSLYRYTFEASDVQSPGIEFYMLAADSYLRLTNAPQYDPGLYPYQVCVQPNGCPVINHEPVATQPAATPMELTCEAYDSTDSIDHVMIFYKKVEDIFDIGTEMEYLGDNTWEGEVPSSVMEANEYLTYYLRAWDNHGTYHDNGPHLVQVVNAVEPREGSPLPEAFNLHQNYPNPFNGQTTLTLDLVQQTAVDLSIYDVNGRLVDKLTDGEWYAPGSHRFIWNATNSAGAPVGSGIYFAALTTDNNTEMRKMVLIR